MGEICCILKRCGNSGSIIIPSGDLRKACPNVSRAFIEKAPVRRPKAARIASCCRFTKSIIMEAKPSLASGTRRKVETNSRTASLRMIRRWREGREFADKIFADEMSRTTLSLADRGFALELFYGVLRNLLLLDFWIGRLRDSRIESNVRDILRIGLYQLLLLETAEHAAVHETVMLASHKQRPVVNGVLRTATRQRSELLSAARIQPVYVRTSHPRFLVERWQQHLGIENAEELCQCNNRPAPIYARINRLRIDPKTFLQIYADSRQPPGNPDFAEFDVLPAAALASGHCYIQDPSTALACQFLDPKPEEKILDACAAPGGKTSYLAQLMKNRGKIIACDRDPNRLQVLQENMMRLGASIVRSIHHDWMRGPLPKEIASIAPFDRVLVDAPCTNTGVIRRRVDVRWRLRPEDFNRMPNEQFAITHTVLQLLKPGGVLVYGTCSLEPEENEGVVRRVLAELPGVYLEAEKDSLPFLSGFDGAWVAKLFKTCEAS
jgi:16S rRNA (cytosine967-C5)-methyltransferase